MCELLAMSSRQPAHLTLSLETLTARSGPDSGTRDGWGAAFYQGHDVALYREPGAANDSALARLLETDGPATTLALTHIRRATLGAVTLANTQPFTRELAGCMHVFAHNGHLPGIAQSTHAKLARFHPVGETDSELAFCALLERLHPLWRTTETIPTLEERLRVVAAFASDLRLLGPANFLYSDGHALFAHGHRRTHPVTGQIESPGLYLLARHCALANEAFHVDGVSVAPGFQEVMLVASVPLSDEPWQALAEGEVIALSAGKVVGRHCPSEREISLS